MKTIESSQAILLTCFAQGRGVTPDLLSIAERVIMGLGDSGFTWAQSFIRALPDCGTETVWRDLALLILIDPLPGVYYAVPLEIQSTIRELAVLYQEDSKDFEAFKEIDRTLTLAARQAAGNAVVEYALLTARLIATVKWNSNYSAAEAVANAAYLTEALAAANGDPMTSEEAFARIGDLVIKALDAESLDCDVSDLDICGLCGRNGCEQCPFR